jgi:chromosome segregation ATPase
VLDDERDSQEETEQEENSQDQDDSDSARDASADTGDDTTSKDADGDDEDELFDRDRALNTIRTLRQEAKEGKAAQKELDRLQKQQKKQERSQQSEAEQLKSDLEERDNELSTLRSENESLKSRIQRASFIEQIGYEPGVARHAWNALPDVGVEPKFDNNHRLTNRKEVVKGLKDYDANLFATGSADGGKRERVDDGGDTDMNQLIRQGFGRS